MQATLHPKTIRPFRGVCILRAISQRGKIITKIISSDGLHLQDPNKQAPSFACERLEG